MLIQAMWKYRKFCDHWNIFWEYWPKYFGNLWFFYIILSYVSTFKYNLINESRKTDNLENTLKTEKSQESWKIIDFNRKLKILFFIRVFTFLELIINTKIFSKFFLLQVLELICCHKYKRCFQFHLNNN